MRITGFTLNPYSFRKQDRLPKNIVQSPDISTEEFVATMSAYARERCPVDADYVETLLDRTPLTPQQLEELIPQVEEVLDGEDLDTNMTSTVDIVSEYRSVLNQLLNMRHQVSASLVEERAPSYHGDPREISIEDLKFSARTYNCLHFKAVLHSLEDLAACSEPELMNLRNFGKVSLMEVKDKLSSYGLSLRATEGGSSEAPKVEGVMDPRDILLEDLNLSMRTYGCFRLNTKVRSLGDLADCAEWELQNIPNLGPMRLQEIKDTLHKYGLSLSIKQWQPLDPSEDDVDWNW